MKPFVNAELPEGSSLQVYALDEHALDVLESYDASTGGEWLHHEGLGRLLADHVQAFVIVPGRVVRIALSGHDPERRTLAFLRLKIRG